MRLGVFGGSFDPIHNAHLIVAQLAREQLALDRVLLTVAASQPFKVGHHGATADQRAQMADLAIAGMAPFAVDRRELRRPGPSFMIDTLRELAVEYAGAELVLVIGADVARGFGAWRDADGVRSLAKIAVCQRNSEPWAPDPGLPAATFDAVVAVPMLQISSTAIRARAARGKSLIGWVPQPVADYIVASQLYLREVA